MKSVIKKQTPTITLTPVDDEDELWNEQEMYRKLCLTIADSLKVLLRCFILNCTCDSFLYYLDSWWKLGNGKLWRRNSAQRADSRPSQFHHFPHGWEKHSPSHRFWAHLSVLQQVVSRVRTSESAQLSHSWANLLSQAFRLFRLAPTWPAIKANIIS